ncbi:thaumatin [Pyrrhoderma noxium]|uniref:Thaumatin n=1 Tax=Pyrrhoderma noxium TaxID=2282107 RepID=A0A286UF93_9AGAM|nr:thaumatin [Pyrrhoderma noxium]
MLKNIALFCLSFLTSRSAARTFTVVNACPFTIWPAIYTDLSVGTNIPDQPTGWEALALSSVRFTVPDDWKAGRIWGRRNCDFSVNPGPNSCATGGCNGGLLCDNMTGTGVPPVSVAEWTLQGDQNLDYYDVSLVDGSDLPMRIDNNVGCPIAQCAVDLGPNCPDPLKGPFDSTGFPLGCKSACFANLDGNQGDSPNCCTGQFNTALTCPSSGVAYYSYFKSNCPDAYAYAYDESSGTALWTCDSGLQADYLLTFCPSTPITASSSATVSATNSGNSTTSALLESSTFSANPTVISGAHKFTFNSIFIFLFFFSYYWAIY